MATHSSILAWIIPRTVFVHEVTKSRTRLSQFHYHFLLRASLVAQTVKNLPAKQIWIRSLGREDPLKKRMATHSSVLT